MTDQSDILGTEAVANVTTPVETTVTTVAPSAEPAYIEQLRTIKNEQGLQKYATVEDAIASTVFAQDHIAKLEAELAKERADKQAALQAQEALAQTQFASTQEQQPQAPGFGREDVYSAMEEYERSKVHKSNRKSVVDTLVQHCNGDELKANELIRNKLQQLGMSREQLASLSETTPSAVYTLFGMDGKGAPTSRLTSTTINTDAVEAHKKMEVPRAKALPIGASSDHLVSAWRDAKADLSNN